MNGSSGVVCGAIKPPRVPLQVHQCTEYGEHRRTEFGSPDIRFDYSSHLIFQGSLSLQILNIYLLGIDGYQGEIEIRNKDLPLVFAISAAATFSCKVLACTFMTPTQSTTVGHQGNEPVIFPELIIHGFCDMERTAPEGGFRLSSRVPLFRWIPAWGESSIADGHMTSI